MKGDALADEGPSGKEVELITERSADALLQILIDRGYFHPTEPVASVATRNEMVATFEDADCNLIKTESYRYETISSLCLRYQAELKESGRLGVAIAGEKLGIPDDICLRVVSIIDNEDSTILRNNDELLTNEYLNASVEAVIESLDRDGILSVSHISRSILKLPFDTTLAVLEGRLSNTIQIQTLDSGAKVLVTQKYIDSNKAAVVEFFSTVSNPVQLAPVCKDKAWQQTWVEDILNGNETMGDLHGDTFIPSSFTEMQRKSVLEAFSTLGFATTENRFLSASQITDCIQHSHFSAVTLRKSIIHPDIIVGPLKTAVQEACSTNHWLDLELHLPLELLQTEEDVKDLLLNHVLGELNINGGAIAIEPHGALFLSPGMIQDFVKLEMPSLVDNYARAKAKEIEILFESNENDTHSNKGKKRGKMGQSNKQQKNSIVGDHSIGSGCVPTADIANALVLKYPDLLSYMSAKCELDSDDVGTGILGKACKEAFHTETHFSVCDNAIKAEVNRLQAAREASARTSRKESAARIQSVEGKFESAECFSAACFMVQAQKNFIRYAEDAGLDSGSVEILNNELLRGACADLTSRVTQFCMFKNAVEMDQFSFRPTGYVTHKDDTYYGPVDTASRSYFPTYFSYCGLNEEAGAITEPLPLLRSLLPGTLGVALARQWVFCGGLCFQGGLSKAEDGKTYARKGDIDGFLSHAEENCLLICGLPFKRLDKKSEKKFLYARRDRLLHMLETETDPAAVLDLTIMVLYQLFKNHVVSGSLLRGPILKLLTNERKVSSDVAEVLKKLADQLEKSDPPDAELVERVRSYGLNKDTVKRR